MTLDRIIKKLFRAYHLELLALNHKYEIALKQAIAKERIQ